MEEALSLLERPEFPRSAKYDPKWVLEHQMGPNALWLMEWLCEALELKPGMRVLDLGCGKAITSIFLAKEFGVRVHAADLWMSPDDNWQRAIEAGVGDLVCPIKAEAHALPFAQGYFDAVVSVDAYQYFGTDEVYLDYLTHFIRPGGQAGVVVVGLMQQIGESIPEHLTTPQANGKVFWENSCRTFKTAEFWKDLWLRNKVVDGVAVEVLKDGWRYWRDFERAVEIAGTGIFPSDAEVLDTDAGRYMGFIRLAAARTELLEWNLYNPSLGEIVRADK